MGCPCGSVQRYTKTIIVTIPGDPPRAKVRLGREAGTEWGMEGRDGGTEGEGGRWMDFHFEKATFLPSILSFFEPYPILALFSVRVSGEREREREREARVWRLKLRRSDPPPPDRIGPLVGLVTHWRRLPRQPDRRWNECQ